MKRIRIEEEFRFRLEKALALRNMKARDLVRITGISESAISQYRKGITEPKRDRLVQIANALQVNASWLMGLDVPMETTNHEAEPQFFIPFNPTDEERILIEQYRCLPDEDREQISSTIQRLFHYAQLINKEKEKWNESHGQ